MCRRPKTGGFRSGTMSSIYINKISSKHSKGRAIVTSAPNEFHEIGAWFVSDLLETNGWQIKYLGANTPKKDPIELSKNYKPDVLAISATMPYNINYASDVISELKNSKETENVKIMLGGQVINKFQRFTELSGADGSAQDAIKAVALAEQWSKLNGAEG